MCPVRFVDFALPSVFGCPFRGGAEMKNLQLYILAAVLLILSVGFFFYKAFILGLPLRPQESVENWEIQAKITFEAKGGPIKFSVFTPRNEGRFTIVDQSVASEGYGLTTGSRDGNPVSVFSTPNAAGRQAQPSFGFFDAECRRPTGRLLPVRGASREDSGSRRCRW
jgi:hypothetical protein